jgi:hypothetical protein
MNINHNKIKLVLLLIICLIPFFGAIVGIVLIILYYNKKDKIWFKIGMLGIVFTFVVYTLIHFIFESSYDSTKEYVALSRRTLFILKQDIENYKNKFGKYPESLEVLQKSDDFIMICDPILLSKRNRDIKTTFEYKSNKSSYILFSVGVDGKANTNDDIYP